MRASRNEGEPAPSELPPCSFCRLTTLLPSTTHQMHGNKSCNKSFLASLLKPQVNARFVYTNLAFSHYLPILAEYMGVSIRGQKRDWQALDKPTRGRREQHEATTSTQSRAGTAAGNHADNGPYSSASTGRNKSAGQQSKRFFGAVIFPFERRCRCPNCKNRTFRCRCGACGVRRLRERKRAGRRERQRNACSSH